ncbi:MAG TPA: hypothetical protein VKY22_15930 [Bradyrhizobium sp.]|nr:hypothetical protein [Bradyrhizobium sp.]
MIGNEDVKSCVAAIGRTAALIDKGLLELRATDRITLERHEAAQDAIDTILSALNVIRGAIEQAERRKPAPTVVPFTRRS